MAEELIRIRFNTKHMEEGQRGLVWRILQGEDIQNAEEKLASDLTISVMSWGSRDILPSGEEKYHMACRGVLHWNGTQAVITPT